jgi:hypothetical protein
MANTCFTCYTITADDAADFQQLSKILRIFWNRTQSVIETDWSPHWLGNLVADFGGDWQKVYCRGEVCDLDLGNDKIWLTTETAWSAMNEVFEFIKEKLPSLHIVWQAEEFGCGYWTTNDEDKAQDKYYLYVDDSEHDKWNSEPYFTGEEEQRLIQSVNIIAGSNYTTVEECLNSENQEKGGYEIYVCEYEPDSLS